MNKLTIIGNLTRDPELRTTTNGKDVCSFTVAVNRKKGKGEEADFFRVTAWEGLAKICSQYLTKGRKVAVVGPVSVSTFTNQNGETKASLEVTADDVEFLSAKADNVDKQTGFTKVEEDDLPFGRA
jgi:single-strand DNA-binding protein